MTFLGAMPYVGYGGLKVVFRAGLGPKLGGRWGGWPGEKSAEIFLTTVGGVTYLGSLCVRDGEKIEENG